VLNRFRANKNLCRVKFVYNYALITIIMEILMEMPIINRPALSGQVTNNESQLLKTVNQGETFPVSSEAW
jgi:hypothetical protein